jgi:hypothetical protein
MYDLDSYPFEKRKAGIFTRLLWWSTGADSSILSRCTYSDHVKYAGLGGIVLATGCLAALSGAYAFYTVFSPRKMLGGLEEVLDIPTVILATVLGIAWGTIVFNLDRFIVSSTGKGDGTEKITFRELSNALPRIIMSLILSIAIAAPLEIRIFKTEIDAELFRVQKERIQELNDLTDKRFADRIANGTADRQNLEKEIREKRSQLDGMRVKLQEEIAGRVGSGKGGVGPAAQQIKQDIALIERDVEKLETRNNSLLMNVNLNIERLTKQRDEEYQANQNQAIKLDGLLQRIILAEEIAGTAIIWLIRLIFIVIETGPIFFKLMLIKSPYDYIEGNIHDEIRARAGMVGVQKIDAFGQPYTAYRSLGMERITAEKTALHDAQLELVRLAIDRWKAKEGERIQSNPEEFIVRERV